MQGEIIFFGSKTNIFLLVKMPDDKENINFGIHFWNLLFTFTGRKKICLNNFFP